MTWRFIQFDYFDAATNMAIDEAILEAHLMGYVPPTLRLYGFQPGAVSVGYAQKVSEEFIGRLKQNGIDLVRRPTGGRAVLHVDDLTYSFIGSTHQIDCFAPPVMPKQRSATSTGTLSTKEIVQQTSAPNETGFLSQSVLQAYKQICSGLIHGFRLLGVELEIGPADRSYKNIDDCFAATTGADLHYKGKKIIGSAQLRRKHAVLQHGSILLQQDQDLMQTLLGIKTVSDAAPARHANLYDILGDDVSIEKLEEALIIGFTAVFGTEFETSQLIPMELDLVQQIRPRHFETQRPVSISIDT